MLSGKFTILNDIIPTEKLFVREGDVTTLDKIVFVACAVVNMCDSTV